MLRETGAFRFSQVTDNGLAEVGQLRYNPTRRAYGNRALVRAGLPYLSFGDPNNDGKLDVIAVGPNVPGDRRARNPSAAASGSTSESCASVELPTSGPWLPQLADIVSGTRFRATRYPRAAVSSRNAKS